MQRLTKSFDVLSGQRSPCRLYTEKSENATPDCLLFIRKASKANESLSEWSKTGLCIK